MNNYERKLEDKAIEAVVKHTLNKVTSIAQKYSQQKAAKEGRSEHQKKQSWKDLVPQALWSFKDRFDEKKAERLPMHRPWDMKVELIPGEPLPIKKKIFKATREEKKAIEEFLNENYKKGWIQRSYSRMAAPVFFVGKKDGAARMVTDYRGLNRITKVDPYPIPIMKTLPDNLTNANWFTTLDLRKGYNNI